MIICKFCGDTKQDDTFVIGASNKPEWCMIEGTGKMACPDCYEQAMNEGQKAIHKHVNIINDKINELDNLLK